MSTRSERNIDKFNKLKRDAEDLQREIDQAKGAKKQLLKELKQEFGVATLKEAKKLLKQLERKESKLNIQLEKEMEKFEKTWKSQL